MSKKRLTRLGMFAIIVKLSPGGKPNGSERTLKTVQ